MKTATFAQRLQKIMNERGLRAVDIINSAAIVGKPLGVKITKSSFSEYMSGDIEPRQDKLTVLSMVLGVSEPWLLGYDVPKN